MHAVAAFATRAFLPPPSPLAGDKEAWPDFVVLMILQFANAIVGFVEERNAGDAVQALKNQLASKCHVCRNGVWATIPGRDLVPGDLIEIKIGDVLPADCILLGKDTVSCDQSALTGESLPVECSPGMRLMMGAAIKRGEAKTIVCGTGKHTAFGEAAKLISGVTHEGRFQKILFRITLVLLIICLVFSTGIFIRLAVNNATDTGRYFNPNEGKFIQVISNVVVIFVASIPVAIEVVCTSTLAVGSRRLAEKKIIVARLSAIEELAGMTVLCSDKTGTLTLNQLQLREPTLYSAQSAAEITFYSALASKREKGNQDAIDLVITSALNPDEERRMHAFEELKFTPFNPTDKRTEAHLVDPVTKAEFLVSKGAPQVILRLCTKDKEALKPKVDKDVQMLGDRGFRALGVALSRTVSPPQGEFLGILSLFDPPRPDTKHTIEQAGENGVIVKMVTGDHLVIAKETCRELGMGTNILDPHVLNDKSISQASLNEQIFNAHGELGGSASSGSVRSAATHLFTPPPSCRLRRGHARAQVRHCAGDARPGPRDGHDGRRRQRRARAEARRHWHRRARRHRRGQGGGGRRADRARPERHHRRHLPLAQNLPAHAQLLHPPHFVHAAAALLLLLRHHRL